MNSPHSAVYTRQARQGAHDARQDSVNMIHGEFGVIRVTITCMFFFSAFQAVSPARRVARSYPPARPPSKLGACTSSSAAAAAVDAIADSRRMASPLTRSARRQLRSPSAPALSTVSVSDSDAHDTNAPLKRAGADRERLIQVRGGDHTTGVRGVPERTGAGKEAPRESRAPGDTERRGRGACRGCKRSGEGGSARGRTAAAAAGRRREGGPGRRDGSGSGSSACDWREASRGGGRDAEQRGEAPGRRAGGRAVPRERAGPRGDSGVGGRGRRGSRAGQVIGAARRRDGRCRRTLVGDGVLRCGVAAQTRDPPPGAAPAAPVRPCGCWLWCFWYCLPGAHGLKLPPLALRRLGLCACVCVQSEGAAAACVSCGLEPALCHVAERAAMPPGRDPLPPGRRRVRVRCVYRLCVCVCV
ncbi:hypothetical protein PybrP1_006461 [[Pythium] brassicae (nom. inval.)]|nr:hypothetical protein PybrP1_006461 [[Pythium] brassicae (nom. inval.)]